MATWSRIVRRVTAWTLLIVIALAARTLRAATPDERFAAAAKHYSQQQWQPAAQQLAAFLETFPNDPRASNVRFFLGEALVQLGNYADARAHFVELLKREPNHRHAKQSLFRAGEAAHFTGDPAAAKQALEQFQQQHPDDALNAYALPYLAEIALGAQDYAVARKLFETALEKYPQGMLRTDCEIGLGTALESLGEVDTALRMYQKLADDPQAPVADEALLRGGVLLYHQKKFDDAAKQLEPFASRFPESQYRITAAYWLGMAHTARKDWGAVVENLDPIREHAASNPLGPAVEFTLAEAQRNLGKLDAAAAGYQRAIDLNAKGDWADDAAYHLTQLAFDAADYERTLALAARFEEQFAKSPLTVFIQQLQAKSLVRENRVAEAIAVLEKLVAGSLSDPQFAAQKQPVYFQLAVTNLAAKKYEAALAALASIEPTDEQLELATSLRSVRASALIGLDRRDEAIAELEAYLKSWPDGPDADKCRAELAALQAAQGEPMKSASNFDQLLKDNPTPALLAQAALARALACEQSGDRDEALAASLLVLEKCPNEPQRLLAMFAAARVAHQLGRNQQAAQWFEQMQKEELPAEIRDGVLYQYAWTLSDLQRGPEAAALFQRLTKDFRDSRYWPDAAYRCAEAAWRKQDFAAAATLLEQIINAPADPEIHSRALYLQGQIAAQEQRWAECERSMRRVVTEFPQSGVRLQAEYWLAEALFQLGELSKASERFAQLSVQLAGRTDEWCAVVPLRHAQLLAQQKKWADAFIVATRIAERYPNFRQQHEVDYVLGRCLTSQGKFEEARELFQRVVQSPRGGTTETAAMAQWMIGESYFHQDRHDEAIQAYLKVDQLFEFPQWQATALLQAGKCHELKGRTKEATRLYAQLIQKFPNSTHTAEATRRLK